MKEREKKVKTALKHAVRRTVKKFVDTFNYSHLLNVFKFYFI